MVKLNHCSVFMFDTSTNVSMNHAL